MDGEVNINPALLIPGAGGAFAKAASVAGLSPDAAVKAQSSHMVDVRRDSNTADSTYTVRYTKASQGAFGLGLDAKAGGPQKLPLPDFDGKLNTSLVPQGSLRGDLFAGSASTVEMRFNNKEEAQRAAETIEKLAAADVVDDGIRQAVPTSSRFAVYEGSELNFINPMSEAGEVNPGVRRAAGVSDEDMQFLGEHVVAQEFSLTDGGRASVEGRLSASGELTLPGGDKFKIPGVELRAGQGIAPGIMQTNSLTRRVEYPTEVSSGRIVDSFTSHNQITAKWRDVQSVGLEIGKGGKAASSLQGQHRADDNYELAMANTSVSFSQSIPPGTQADLGYLATRKPDLSGPATVDSWVMTPAGPEAKGLMGTFNPFGSTTGQAPDGQQRVDMSRTHLRYKVSAVTGTLMVNQMHSFTGGLTGTLMQNSRQGDFIDNRTELVKRDGNNKTESLRLAAAGFAGAEGSLTGYSGVDNFAKEAAPKQVEPYQPLPQQHYQVQPHSGVNVRSSPTTEGDNKVTKVQSGSYLGGTSETKLDNNGDKWVQVRGRDEHNKVVEGWVRGDTLKVYDKRYGDNNATGRVNPTLEKAGRDKVIAQQNDNLWSLAAEHDQDFDKLLATNPHLLDPRLIFKGDSVYLPDR
ncbi:MAG: SH3 domain-containing protein [Pseudomonadota bacterium]|nr:SH3 domain-containing protein [Pseudomonadota bacterium]